MVRMLSRDERQEVSTPKFDLGTLVMTPGAKAEFSMPFMSLCVGRHISGDWGDCSPDDSKRNDLAVAQGERILSVYGWQGKRLYVITEWDRSVTTLLLPEEY